MELVRLETPEKAKSLLAKAIASIPKSERVWLAAAQREADKTMKIKILKRGLEFISNSSKIWKELVELVDENEAKALLYRAVECLPTDLELWLALAKLETYDKAKVILNQARTHLPQEIAVWVYAAKLEESYGKTKDEIVKMIGKSLKVLEKNRTIMKREDWLKEAMIAENSGNPFTCEAIIIGTIGLNLSEEEKEKAWLEDSENCEKNGFIQTARNIYMYMASYFKGRKSL